MPLVNLEYRLRVTLPAGDLVLTSQRGGVNPYLASPPSGDGTEFDPLTGHTAVGAYTVRVIDAPVSTGPTVRVVTGQLFDGGNRYQWLSRRAVLEFRQRAGLSMGDVSDAFAGSLTAAQAAALYGGAWVQLCSGYVTDVRLVDGITYEIAVGESLRIEQSVSAFSPIVAGVDLAGRPVYEDPTAYLARWPQRGCLLGGPLTAAWLTIPTGAGWVCQSKGADAAGNTILLVKSGSVPPAWKATSDLETLVAQSERTTSAYWDPQSVYDTAGNPTNAIRQYPGLLVLVNGAVYRTGKFTSSNRGTDTGRTAQLVGRAPGLFDATAFGNGRGTFTVDGPAIPAGQSVRVQVLSLLPSEGAPLYWTGHPVDLLAKLWSEARIVYDAASLEVVRAALGGDRRLSVRVKAPTPLAAWLEANLFGPFGIGARLNDAGALEAFATRVLPSSVPSLTLDGTCLDTEGAEPFGISEASAVTRVVFEHELYGAASTALDVAAVDPDGVATRVERIERANADATTYGTREQAYKVAGMVGTAGGTGGDAAPAVDVLARDIFDRWGRGLPTARVRLLRGAIDRTLEPKLGGEVLVNHPAMPNTNRRLGDVASVGARSWQVVALTQSPRGVELRLADYGNAAAPIATLPTLSIAQGAADPRMFADVTVTNAAALNAGGLGARVQVATTTTAVAPAVTAGSDATAFPAGNVPTAAFALPRATAGLYVWARARSENTSARPSSWSAWVGVRLAALPAPTGLVATAIGRESASLAWTNGSATDGLELYALAGSSAPSDWSGARVAALPRGSTVTKIRRLDGPSLPNVVGIAHVDGNGGRSVVTWITFATATSTGVAPRPAGLSVFTSGALDARLDTGIALAVYAADEVYDVNVYRAPDVAGAPNTGAAVLAATIPGDSTTYVDYLPSDGAIYWYALSHSLSGETESGLTPWRSGVVGSIPRELVRPSASLPLIDVTDTEGTTTATIALTITDPQGRVTLVEFRTDPGTGFGAWAAATTPYTATVAMPTTGFARIEWRVTGYDDLGNLETLAADGESFDRNTSSDIVTVSGAFTGAGALIATVGGDSDTLSTRVGVSTTSASAAATAAGAASPVNGRQQEVTFPGPYAIGASVYVAAIGYNAAAGGGTASPTMTVRLVRPGSEIIVQEQPSESGNLGTLSLVVTDRAAVVSAVQFRTQQGRGGWSAWTAPATTTGSAPTFTYTASVTLLEKVTSKIGYRVVGTDSAGNAGVILDEDVVPFLAGPTPAIPDIAANVDIATGIVAAVLTGDSDTNSTRVGVSTSSSAAAQSAAFGAAALNGRVGIYAALATLAEGGRLYLAALAYSGTGGTGFISGMATAEVTRSRDTVGIAVAAKIVATSPTSISVVVTATDPTGLSSPSVAISDSTGITGGITGSGTPITPYVIPRPTFGGGGGRVLFAGTAAGRATGYDAVDVPEQLRDTVSLDVRLEVTSVGSLWYNVVAVVTDPLGTASPTLSVVNTGGASYGGAGTLGSPWIVDRPAAGAGTAHFVAQATAAGRASATAAIDIPERAGSGGTSSPSPVVGLVDMIGNSSTGDFTVTWSGYNPPSGATYTVYYRRKGAASWTAAASGGSSTSATFASGVVFDNAGNVTAIAAAWFDFEVQMIAAGTVCATSGVVDFTEPIPAF